MDPVLDAEEKLIPVQEVNAKTAPPNPFYELVYQFPLPSGRHAKICVPAPGGVVEEVKLMATDAVVITVGGSPRPTSPGD